MNTILERRKRGTRDIGIRTRRSDVWVAPVTPQSNPDWNTTFHLRWWEHLRKRRERPQATSG
jgi:hypothetical protein